MAHSQIIPQGQKWFTNVAIVTLDVPPNHFEIACYQNKIAAFRNGSEKDVLNVLQTDDIFSNAVRGYLASKETLMASFYTIDRRTICMQILANGKQYLTGLERKVEASRLRREIIYKAASRCVNPRTGKPLSFYAFESGINEIQWKMSQFPVSEQAADLCEKLGYVIDLQMGKVDLIIWFNAEAQAVLEDVIDCSGAIPDGLYRTLFCSVDPEVVGRLKGLEGVYYQVEKSFSVRIR